jgi:hypothetical protein
LSITVIPYPGERDNCPSGAFKLLVTFGMYMEKGQGDEVCTFQWWEYAANGGSAVVKEQTPSGEFISPYFQKAVWIEQSHRLLKFPDRPEAVKLSDKFDSTMNYIKKLCKERGLSGETSTVGYVEFFDEGCSPVEGDSTFAVYRLHGGCKDAPMKEASVFVFRDARGIHYVPPAGTDGLTRWPPAGHDVPSWPQRPGSEKPSDPALAMPPDETREEGKGAYDERNGKYDRFGRWKSDK